MRLAPRMAIGPLAAMRAASACASASRRSPGWTASTSPSRSSSAASSSRPVHMISSARARPTSIGKRTGPPAPGKPPHSASGSANVACAAASRMSQASESSAAPARAAPFSAAITIWGSASQRVVEAVGGPHQVEDLRLGVARADRRIEDPHREERRAGAGQHDRLDLVVARQRVHVALQRQQDLAGQAVLVGGPIDGDGGDPAVAAKHHLCAGHATFIEADAGLVNAGWEIVGSRAAQISTRSLPGGTGCARCCAMRSRARKLRDLIVVRRHHPAPTCDPVCPDRRER